MQNDATSVEAYLNSLPDDRRAAISMVRDTILRNLPEGYKEGMQYGMIGYYVPHSRFPAGYHCDPKQPLNYLSLGSQKNYMSLYLMNVYGDTQTREWFENAYRASGKKLDMGKACVRFKTLEDLPLEVIGEVVARTPVDVYLNAYLAVLAEMKSRKKR